MQKRKTLYALLGLICFIFIVYALVKNYWIDPEAYEFLSNKSGLKREFNVPVWLNIMYVHVAFACIAMASGLLNFSTRLFQKSRQLHRFNGYIYIVSVLLVVLTSGYMAPYATGGKISSIGFNLLNIAWPLITVTALIHIKKKRITQHRNWMIRSYVFCFTNMFIHLITFVFHKGLGFIYSDSYTIGIYGAIALLLVISEVIIRRISRGGF